MGFPSGAIRKVAWVHIKLDSYIVSAAGIQVVSIFGVRGGVLLRRKADKNYPHSSLSDMFYPCLIISAKLVKLHMHISLAQMVGAR